MDPDLVEAELSAFYDEEGDERLRRPMEPEREAARTAFVASLPAGCLVLEIGSGPGRDAIAFVAAGHRYVAMDLSVEHARRCHGRAGAVVAASARRIPFQTGVFGAVWTMSTLMHVPNSAIDGALGEVRRVLRSGGVAAIGVWGGVDIEEHSPEDAERGRIPRLFSRRSDARWQSLLAVVGTVESFATWGGEPGFSYQFALVRRA